MKTRTLHWTMRLCLLVMLAVLVAPVAAQDSEDAGKALLTAFWAAEASRDYASMDALIADDFVRHSVATDATMPGTVIASRDAYIAFLQGTAAMFPDYAVTPQMLVEEDDFVAFFATFAGTFPPTGNHIEMPMAGMARIEDGKLAELWVEWDNLTWNTQMGVQEPVAGAVSPVGMYETAISRTDVSAAYYNIPADLVGHWTLEFKSDASEIEWSFNALNGSRHFTILSRYALDSDIIEIEDNGGDYDCAVLTGEPSIAHYTLVTDNGQLIFADADDNCIQRRIVLTSHPWTCLDCRN